MFVGKLKVMKLCNFTAELLSVNVSLRGQCALLHLFPGIMPLLNTHKSFNAYNYIQAMHLHNIHIHRVGFTTLQLVQDPSHISYYQEDDESGKYCT